MGALSALGLGVGCSGSGTITGGSPAAGQTGTGGSLVGSGTGGQATGGALSGGTTSGGTQGQTTSGGAATGGSTGTTGGGSSGGASTGGAATGGTSASGASSGGTGTEGGSAGAGTGGSATGGVAAPDPVTCSTPLAERVAITSIPVTPEVETNGSGINSVSLPVILSTAPGGRAKVAWSDGTDAHVTPLDEADQRAGDDLVIPGSEVRGFVAHDDGSALIVVRDDAMVFVRLDDAGAVQATLDIVGTESHDIDGSRWIDDWPHQGRLAWSGTQYAAYFGQTGNHGEAGNHQGDQYAIIGTDGVRAQGGWDWGCSHSLDVRIAHNGSMFAPLCISDTYPGAGIFLSNRTEVSEEPTVTNVGGIAKLGGLVPAEGEFLLTFTSPEDRESPDIVFLHMAEDGEASGRVYLTDTPDIDEGYAHLARYGDALLAGWDSGAEVSIVMIDASGAVLEGPVVTTAQIGGQDDFATFANGDAGWAGAWDGNGEIKVVRVRRCE